MSDVLNVSEMFGKNVFNDAVMRDRLSKNVYRKLKKTIEDGAELDPSVAGVVAYTMKDWVVEGGAAHYIHRFQPLTGVIAEKHDSFTPALSGGKVTMESSGKELIKGEPGASSFPSGSLRATFEAREYTVWDCTSPAFLREDAIGMTLCTPTSFCSYKGEALDKKTPLLRSMQTVNEQALRILRLSGNTIAKRVVPSVGAKQEYFLVDREKYLQCKDLIYTGRTLFGAMPPKGQELEDHHFGAIREGIGSYMNNVDKELWKLDVLTKTQHNEVVPAQYELTPIYEGVNQAADHNQIVMETPKKVAGCRSMAYLLREKSFVGVNGSGKHDNWSLTVDDGTNLLNPGDTPYENIQSPLVLACIIKAVDVHADLLRGSAPGVGDDRRLGASKTPPAIISISLGEQLKDVTDQPCSAGEATHSKQSSTLETGVDILPDLDKDTTDRNHTLPSAFTGNKFEFRIVGSSDSIASPNTVLNTIMAEAFKEAADILEKVDDFDMVVYDFIKKTLAAHKKIIFNGNGYSGEWVVEAERRGSLNIRSVVDVIPAPTMNKTVKLFEAFGVFTKAELESRSEVEYGNYPKVINTEARTIYDTASKSIIPVVIKYTTQFAASIGVVKGVCQEADVSTQTELPIETPKLLTGTKTAPVHLLEATEKAAVAEGGKDQAIICHSQVVSAMEAPRALVGQLEMIMDKEL